MSTPSITVLLPVYNSERTLEETLSSLWAQTCTDFEVLVVDDGSTDATPEILEACGDSRLRVLRNPERLKLSGALNRGILEAKGDYIARMDADDRALPHRLAVQKAFLDEHPDLAVCGTATRHFGAVKSKTERYPDSAEAIRAFTLFNCPFAHPTVMFRRSVFQEADLAYDGSYYPTEDFELWTRVVHRFPCANLSEVTLEYRVHDQSMTGADWENMDAQAQRLIREQFARLGVELDADQARLHREIGMARVEGRRIEEARDHLVMLLQRNEEQEFCPRDAFRREVRERWFHVCINTQGSGREGWYADTGIWGAERAPLFRRLLLRASEWRRK